MKHWIAFAMTTALAASAWAAEAAVTPFTFAHISDTHMAVSTSATKFDKNLQAAIAEMNAASPRPAFIIHTGDITEMGQEDQFLLYKRNVKDALMPIKHSPGNHETRWADKSINRFTEQLGSPNVSFKRNGVRFIGFNAAIWLEHHGAVSGDTRRWIVSQLKLDPPGTPAVLFTHQPPMYPDNIFTTGDMELWEAIKPYNVRLFLSGHGHINKEWTVNGIYCKMVKGMMNDQGAYALYEVDPNEIRVYTKMNGEERNQVATVPIKAPRVDLKPQVAPRAGATVAVGLTVKSHGPQIARVEYNVDYHERRGDKNWTAVEAGAPGRYAFNVNTGKLAPGRHTLGLRAVDTDGGVWITSVDLPRAGSVRAFQAGTALQGPSAVDDANVYVGGWDGVLYAVNRATMKPRWKFQTGGAIIGRPDVDAAAVYFGSTDENIYAVRKDTGKVIWKAKTGGPIQAHARVSGDTVYAASGDHNLYALDAKTGKVRWAYKMGLHAQARPIVANGMVYLGAWDGKFHAVDARTGKARWTYDAAKLIFFSPAVSSPLLVDGKIITTMSVAPSDTEGPQVACLDALTGEKIWGYRLPAGSSAYATPTSDGKKVFLATLSGDLYALDLADGKRLWESKMGEIAYDCSPTYHNGQVICNTLLGSVEGHDAETGERLWAYKTGTGFTFAWPTIAGDTVYQPSMDGTLTAIPIPKT